MAQPSKFPASVRGLLGANAILHTISGIFTGIWVSMLVAPNGDMTAIGWCETFLSVVAVSVGLTYGTYMALQYLPSLEPERRRGAMLAFISAYTALALILAVAAASVLASAAGERAHMESSLEKMKTATEDRRRAFASISNRVPALSECIDTATAMSAQETATGAFSREGGDAGRVAITLSNIATGCATARSAVYASRANLSRLFERIDRLLLDMRRVIDVDADRHLKLVTVRKQGDEFQRLARGVNDALAVEAMQSVADAMRKDWNAAGLPASGAAAITQNFEGLSEALTDGLDDIAALKDRPLPSVPAVSNIAYLAMYPDATMGALAIGICIELIPLGAILLGLSIMTQTENEREDDQAPHELAQPLVKPRTPRKRLSNVRDASLHD